MKIVLSRPLPLPQIMINGKNVEIVHYGGDVDVFNNAQVYLTTGVDPVPASLIQALPKSVKLIANIAVGIDNIDIDTAKVKNIAVTNTPVVTEDTADLAFALILSACRQLSVNERFLRNGDWSKSAPMAAAGVGIHDKTLGIIGFGEIGQAVAKRAKGFGMKVVYCGPSRKPEAEALYDASYCEVLEELLKQADIVSLHCPSTPETKYIINRRTITDMKDGAVLINTGRGALVQDDALIDALRSGKLFAAGLDVFEGEPELDKRYLALSNVTLTPHIGSATHECRTNMVMKALENVCALLEGKPLVSAIKM
ncbi:2-hydroxyacid dehydrogenase [Colwellia sp. MEBiC06753]